MSARLSLTRLGRWPRLLAAAACLLLAAISALHSRAAATGSEPTGMRVVVAARDVAAGRTLVAADLRLTRWPGASPPTDALRRLPAVLGQRLAGPLARGDPITRTRLLGSALTLGLPAGRSAVPVTLADPRAVDLIRPGDRVDLLATPDPDADPDVVSAGDSGDGGAANGARGPGKTIRVGARLLVLAVLRGGDDASTEVVLAAGSPETLRLARAPTLGVLTAVVVA